MPSKGYVKDHKGESNINNLGTKMIIIECRNNHDIDILFPDYEWVAKNKSYSNFKKGEIKCPYEPRYYGVGYQGEGEYETMTDAYWCWLSMLKRCYSEKHQENHSSYKECEVCKEWHNYQNFAKWYEKNYYNCNDEIMQLDKDILCKGNKIYSPQTCIFTPQSINKIFQRRGTNKTSNLPQGVTIQKEKYVAICNKKYLGRFSTVEEAFNVYKNFKENYIKQIADEYKMLIPRILYEALYQYKIEIND